MRSLDIEEEAALSEIVHGRASSSALKKFFADHAEYYTNQARNYLNVIPTDLHAAAKNEAQARFYAAQARAYETMWAELEMKAKG